MKGTDNDTVGLLGCHLGSGWQRGGASKIVDTEEAKQLQASMSAGLSQGHVNQQQLSCAVPGQ